MTVGPTPNRFFPATVMGGRLHVAGVPSGGRGTRPG